MPKGSYHKIGGEGEQENVWTERQENPRGE
jgi:hypothetical protein